jgi:uncharacterized protein YlxW (UPF0749 family)
MPRHLRRPSPWTVLVPVVVVLAGLMFGVSARTSGGSDLRSDRSRLADLVQASATANTSLNTARSALQKQIDQLQSTAAQKDQNVAAAQQRGTALQGAAGLSPVAGNAVEVSLNDAPLGPSGTLPVGARPDDVVIHQSDVQAVVNAMWVAGADAVTVMGIRLIGTSAVRCVGNTLLLAGRTYSPPFVIVGIGDQAAIEKALGSAPGVQVFLEAVKAFGLGYQVRRISPATAPGYDGSLGVSVATPVG